MENLEFRLLEHYRFGIIDPLLNPLMQEQLADLPKYCLAPDELDIQKNVLPCLVDFSELSRLRRLELFTSLELNFSHKIPCGFSALFASARPAETLVAHLRKQFIRIDLQNNRTLFRFHDPRVWLQLQWMLDTTSIQQLMGPIDKWMYQLDWTWHVFEKPENEGSSSARPNRRQQQVQIERIGLINRVIKSQSLPSNIALIETGKKVSQLIERAQLRHNMSDAYDLIAYAIDGLILGDAFDAHPLIVKTLKQLSDPEITYKEAMRDIDSDAMKKITAELNSANRRNT
ncbi:DUF4123 domain-containing protein [Undibacterium sp. Ren11W]|uniref:DUF4123 domain-containing protein n=1 Tax=Undibacterium sp. Ren11W TaxID=3413045 RepID=UPI003BF00DF3